MQCGGNTEYEGKYNDISLEPMMVRKVKLATLVINSFKTTSAQLDKREK